MEALKCPHCGTRHWPRQKCPATAEAIAEEKKQQIARNAVRQFEPPVRQNTPVKQPDVRQDVRQTPLLDTPVKHPTKSNSDHRKTYLRNYMRDYMRQRRAQQATISSSL